MSDPHLYLKRVVRLAEAGYTAAEVANALRIQHDTVTNYLKRARKAGLTTFRYGPVQPNPRNMTAGTDYHTLVRLPSDLAAAVLDVANARSIGFSTAVREILDAAADIGFDAILDDGVVTYPKRGKAA